MALAGFRGRVEAFATYRSQTAKPKFAVSIFHGQEADKKQTVEMVAPNLVDLVRREEAAELVRISTDAVKRCAALSSADMFSSNIKRLMQTFFETLTANFSEPAFATAVAELSHTVISQEEVQSGAVFRMFHDYLKFLTDVVGVAVEIAKHFNRDVLPLLTGTKQAVKALDDDPLKSSASVSVMPDRHLAQRAVSQKDIAENQEFLTQFLGNLEKHVSQGLASTASSLL